MVAANCEVADIVPGESSTSLTIPVIPHVLLLRRWCTIHGAWSSNREQRITSQDEYSRAAIVAPM